MPDLKPGKTVIFHVRWMEFYAGAERNLPKPHFRHLKETGEAGGERFNFLRLDGRCYAYVPFRHERVDLARAGGGQKGASSVDAMTVIVTATSPEGGARIVGWYENARLHAESRSRPRRLGHCRAEAAATSTYRIPEGERNFIVPRLRTSYPGVSPLTYISDLNPTFERKILRHLNDLRRAGIRPVSATDPRGGLKMKRTLADPETRSRIELAAERIVTEHYEAKHSQNRKGGPQKVRRVAHEKPGWDLETDRGLRIEVKGRFARIHDAELTPREYVAFDAAQTDPKAAATYRLAIVGAALDKNPDLAIFHHSAGEWRCELTDRLLEFRTKPGAIVWMQE